MATFNDRIMGYVRSRLEGEKVRPVAVACGLNPDLLGKWLRGDRSPGLSSISPLLDYLGVLVQLPDEGLADCEYIPKVSARAGAGSSLETSSSVEGTIPFRKSFLAKSGLHSRSCILLDVVGDSMEPLLRTGDTIMVDTSDTNVVDGKIYLVAVGEELLVKRLQKTPTGLLLRSDNPIYADIPVAGEDVGSLAIVHGRVRWVGKNL